ncbi:MAG: hypothetical protein JWP10_785, partial [Nocardioidaceae bacterium]|nr:hypothetical protein [Nocardioidaceae bacterium]
VVSVRSSAGAERGDVEIREGSTVIARSTLKSGNAVFNLSSGTLSAGTHSLQAFYLGGSAEPSASVPTTITVAKAKSYTGLYVPASIKITRNVDITVGVIVARVARPTGTITVFDGTDVVGEYPLVVDRFRSMKIRLPKFDATGTHRISVVYSGTDDITGSRSSVRKLVVVN